MLVGIALLVAQQTLQVPVRFVVLSDDNGRREASVRAVDAEEWIAGANEAFRPAKVAFSFDKDRDFVVLKSTLLNGIGSPSDEDWGPKRVAAAAIASERGTAITVLVRRGPDKQPATRSFASVFNDFVVMAQPRGEFKFALAHEIGHYLSLLHTFDREFETVDEAEEFVKLHGTSPNGWEADGIDDTLDGPFIRELDGRGAAEVALLGVKHPLCSDNLMSYYRPNGKNAPVLSEGQVERVRWALERRLSNAMSMGARPAGAPMEAERLTVVRWNGADSWSGGVEEVYPSAPVSRSAWFVSGQAGSGAVVKFTVSESGEYELGFSFVDGPLGGPVTVQVDGYEPTRYDTYAPIVLCSPPLRLGPLFLDEGRHTVALSVGSQPVSGSSGSWPPKATFVGSPVDAPVRGVRRAPRSHFPPRSSSPVIALDSILLRRR